MKIDIDTIFYIVISILILAITGLSRRKKKGIIPKTGLQNIQEMKPGMYSEEVATGQEDRISDPFESLEKLFLQTETVTAPEAVSLEELIDEETEYLKEKEAAEKAGSIRDEMIKEDLAKQSSLKQDDDKGKQAARLDLFRNVDELKKAVIYSEILHRKEY